MLSDMRSLRLLDGLTTRGCCTGVYINASIGSAAVTKMWAPDKLLKDAFYISFKKATYSDIIEQQTVIMG